MRAAARAAGEDIIDLGMGNPDLPPPEHVIEKLCEVARKPDAHGYSQSKGIPGLRKAQANYYARRFGVEVDPETEVVVTMGSKEGLASLATAITAPGDVVLAPNPSYPIHTFGFIIAGATIRAVPTTPDEHYFESLERAMNFTVPRPSDPGGELSVEPDRGDGRPRFLRAARRLGEGEQGLDHLRPRLFRALL
jgi:alanine-synthesizing transaminase